MKFEFMNNAPVRKKWRAVLMSDLAPAIAPVVEAWARSGNELVAAVAPNYQKHMLSKARRYEVYAPQWSWTGKIGRYAPSAPILFFDEKTGWQDLALRLKELHADLVICAYLGHKIPMSFLEGFPLGGVNLHPALLPGCAGPQPIHHMVANNSHRELGGVTMHVMNAKFDDGPIIASARFDPSAWRDKSCLQASISGAMAALVHDALPAWCSGERQARAQPETGRSWAGVMRKGFDVHPEWTFEHLIFAAEYLSKRPGLFVSTPESRIRVGKNIKKIGQPSGMPAQARGRAVEFDVSNARVVAWPVNPVDRRIGRIVKSFKFAFTRPASPASIA